MAEEHAVIIEREYLVAFPARVLVPVYAESPVAAFDKAAGFLPEIGKRVMVETSAGYQVMYEVLTDQDGVVYEDDFPVPGVMTQCIRTAKAPF